MFDARHVLVRQASWQTVQRCTTLDSDLQGILTFVLLYIFLLTELGGLVSSFVGKCPTYYSPVSAFPMTSCF